MEIQRKKTGSSFRARAFLGSLSLSLLCGGASLTHAAPVKSASVLLPGHTAKTRIQYQVHQRRVVFQGDIDLGTESELRRKKPIQRTSRQSSSGVGSVQAPLIVRSGEKFLWPDGIVPFTIDDNVSMTLRQQIQIATNEWNSRTNINLTPRRGHKDYVHFIKNDRILGSGQSRVGRQGRRQNIKLKTGASAGTVIHEIGHAVGLWHEQARMDRDSQIEILWDNISREVKHNFNKHVRSGIDIGPYDMLSVMHYSPFAFGKTDPLTNRSLRTLRSRVPGQSINPGARLSALDVQGINQIYPRTRTERPTPPPICNSLPTVFEHDNFRGRRMALKANVATLHQFKLGDTISSVCVPASWTLRLWEDKSYKGKSLSVTGPRTIADLKRDRPNGSNWGDRISSVQVHGPQTNQVPQACADKSILFKDDHYRGQQFDLTHEVRDLHQHRFGNTASSVCVPAGWRIELFNKKDFNGARLSLTGRTHITDLKRNRPQGMDWGDSISSARVLSPTGAPTVPCSLPVLFKHDTFRGTRYEISRTIPNLHEFDAGDKTSSVCLPPGWDVTLYTDKNFAGKALRLVGPQQVKDLKRGAPDGTNWGDKISSVRVNSSR